MDISFRPVLRKSQLQKLQHQKSLEEINQDGRQGRELSPFTREFRMQSQQLGKNKSKQSIARLRLKSRQERP